MKKPCVHLNIPWQPASPMLPQIYFWTIHCIKWWVHVQYKHRANGQQNLVENKTTPMIVCIDSAYFCSDNFHFRNCHLNSAISTSHLSPKWICQPVSTLGVYCFVLHEIHISKIAINDALNASAFDFIYKGVLHKAIFGSIHAWRWLWEDPEALHHLPLFQTRSCIPRNTCKQLTISGLTSK